MTKGNNPNPFDTHRSVGAQGAVRRALVVNVMDPQKAGRVQIREVGHMEDMQGMPDQKLPWVKIQGGTSFAGMQGATDTHSLMPGSMVYVNGYGEGGQDIVITGTVGNDEKGENQSIHPATQGKQATDKVFTNDDYHKQRHGWHKDFRSAYTSRTTQEARQNRRAGRQSRLTDEPIEQGVKKAQVPDHYGKRKAAKDSEGGTIGTSMFDNSANAQKYIKDKIQNASAIVPNALDAMEQLKKVTGNPTSIQSIGAGNFSAIMSQLKALRSGGGQQQQQDQYDCEKLKNTPDEQLTPELLERKRTCILLEQELNEEQNNANV